MGITYVAGRAHFDCVLPPPSDGTLGGEDQPEPPRPCELLEGGLLVEARVIHLARVTLRLEHCSQDGMRRNPAND